MQKKTFQVFIEARDPGSLETSPVRKIVNLPAIPTPGVPFRLMNVGLNNDYALAQEVTPPRRQKLAMVVIHVTSFRLRFLRRRHNWQPVSATTN